MECLMMPCEKDDNSACLIDMYSMHDSFIELFQFFSQLEILQVKVFSVNMVKLSQNHIDDEMLFDSLR